MTARTWNAGDPEPPDRPAVVDDDGVTWIWVDVLDDDYYVWTRLQVTQLPGPPGQPHVFVGYRTAYDWEEMLDEYGPLREATPGGIGQLRVSLAQDAG